MRVLSLRCSFTFTQMLNACTRASFRETRLAARLSECCGSLERLAVRRPSSSFLVVCYVTRSREMQDEVAFLVGLV